MKIVMIGSSFRPGGNTEQILDLLQDALRKEAEAQRLDLEIDRLSLSREAVQPCRGCRLCFDRGEEFCPNRDGVLSLQKKLESADAVVAASPVYVEDVNGIMKTWIDRMAFNCHRPAFCGKCAAVLTTSGNGSSGHAASTLANALGAWGFRVVARGKFRMGAQMEPEQAAASFQARLDRIASKLLKAIFRQPEQSPSLSSLIAFRIQQATFRRSAPRTKDRLFWEERGWLGKGAVCFSGKRPGAAKVLFAGLIGFVVRKLILT